MSIVWGRNLTSTGNNIDVRTGNGGNGSITHRYVPGLLQHTKTVYTFLIEMGITVDTITKLTVDQQALPLPELIQICKTRQTKLGKVMYK